MLTAATELSRTSVSMEFKQLLLLLPCHSLEDFPTHHQGDDAENLLMTWTCAWHPALLVQAGKMPTWNRVEEPPADCNGCVILIPKVSKNRLPSGFLGRCVDQGGFSLSVSGDRAADVQEIAAAIGCQAAISAISQDTTDQFYALSYTYLQIELLTRQLRYSSNLDQVHFETQLLKAAAAATAGDFESMDLAIERCYDVLSEERHRYYPMDSFLLDVTLLASTTLGASLRQQLNDSYASNWIVTSSLLQQLKTKSPEIFEQVKQRCEEGSLHLAGGCHNQPPNALLSLETVRRNVNWGQAFAQAEVGRPFEVFARRTPGLEATLPGPLKSAGFRGAMHQNFEDATIPLGSHANFRWEGIDGQTLNSLTKTMCDASQPATFLRLGIQIGEALDIDHVAVTQLVHWPSAVSPVFYDLVNSTRRSDALGKWCTLADVFDAVHDPGYSESISSADYRANDLGRMLSQEREASSLALHVDASDAVDSSVSGPKLNVVSQVQCLIQTEDRLRQTQFLAGMLQLAQGGKRSFADLADAAGQLNFDQAAPEVTDSATMGSEDVLQQASQLLPIDVDQLNSLQSQMSCRLAGILAASGSDDCLIFNADAQVQRMLLTPEVLGKRSLAAVPVDQVYGQSRDSSGSYAVVDIPAMGYIHLAKLTSANSALKEKSQPRILSGESTLRNEFLEATIDVKTGALRSIHNYEGRSNLCSLQLAWFDSKLQSQIKELLAKSKGGDWKSNLAELWSRREGDDGKRRLAVHQGGYTSMDAENVQVVLSNSIVAKIKATGALRVLNKRIADFEIHYQLYRGSRFLEVDCVVTPVSESFGVKLSDDKSYQFPPDASAKIGKGYRSYFGWRLAHAQPSADIVRDLNTLRQDASRPYFEAPHLVEFSGTGHRLAVLTNGLAFHRVPADGKLDSLISHQPHEPFRSKYRIGLSPKNVLAVSLASSTPLLSVPCGSLKPNIPAAAWLFQCSSPHVILTSWENRYVDGQFAGLKVRMVETTGKNRKFRLDFATAARTVTLTANDPHYVPNCKVSDGAVACDISPFEQLELWVEF